MDPMMDKGEEDTLWIRTTPTPDFRGYMAVLEVTADHSYILTEARALKLAHHIQEACTRAEYDAKVFNLYRTTVEMPENDCKGLVMELRMKRPMIEADGLPFTMVPSVNADGKPFLVVQVDQEAFGQVDLPEAYELSTHVLMAPKWAKRDEEYFAFLTEDLKLEEEIARNMIDSLSH